MKPKMAKEKVERNSGSMLCLKKQIEDIIKLVNAQFDEEWIEEWIEEWMGMRTILERYGHHLEADLSRSGLSVD